MHAEYALDSFSDAGCPSLYHAVSQPRFSIPERIRGASKTAQTKPAKDGKTALQVALWDVVPELEAFREEHRLVLERLPGRAAYKETRRRRQVPVGSVIAAYTLLSSTHFWCVNDVLKAIGAGTRIPFNTGTFGVLPSLAAAQAQASAIMHNPAFVCRWLCLLPGSAGTSAASHDKDHTTQHVLSCRLPCRPQRHGYTNPCGLWSNGSICKWWGGEQTAAGGEMHLAEEAAGGPQHARRTDLGKCHREGGSVSPHGSAGWIQRML